MRQREGRPRDPFTWELLPIDIADALLSLNAMQPHFDRGYTGHEHMAGFGLINMNGRLYDPYLQRFLSPDPYVQEPGNAQNYNRYSYCLNNPLMYTDPSGELVWLAFAAYGAWVMGVNAGIAAEQAGGHFWKDGFWKGALVGFAAGALGGSGLAPFGTQWLGTTAWGAMVGAGSQAGAIWAMGGSDYSGIWKGALLGGAMGFMASEQFGNLASGKGFVSNEMAEFNSLLFCAMHDPIFRFSFQVTVSAFL